MAEFAYEPEPAGGVVLAPGESAREIAGKSPWRLAGRRLLRNRVALAAAGLCVLIVVVSFGAPLYAEHIAHTDPFANNLNGTTVVDGKKVEVLQQGGGPLKLGETPIGPTWQSNYFLGADNQGRDVMARVLYGGGAAPRLGGWGAVPACRPARPLGGVGGPRCPPRAPSPAGGRVLPRAGRHGPLAPDGPHLGVPDLPARDLARDRALDGAGRAAVGAGPRRPVEPVGPDAHHRARLRAVRVPAGPRPGALRAREGVRRGGDLPGRIERRADVRRDPPERRDDRDRDAAADDRHDDPHRVGAVVPVDRGAAAEGELGHDHRRRPGPALQPALGGDRAGDHDRADGAFAERARRRRPRCARPAGEAPHQGLSARLRRPPPRQPGRRPVRDHGPDVPDLLRDAGRRPDALARRAKPDAGDRRRRAPPVRPRPLEARAVRADDEAAVRLARPRLVRQPGAEGRAGYHRGGAGDV